MEAVSSHFCKNSSPPFFFLFFFSPSNIYQAPIILLEVFHFVGMSKSLALSSRVWSVGDGDHRWAHHPVRTQETIPPLKEYTRIRDRPEEGTIKSAPGKGVKIHLNEAPILCHSHDSPMRISVPARCGAAEDGILKQRGRYFDPTPSDFKIMFFPPRFFTKRGY